jgi:hypothetical protein
MNTKIHKKNINPQYFGELKYTKSAPNEKYTLKAAFNYSPNFLQIAFGTAFLFTARAMVL